MQAGRIHGVKKTTMAVKITSGIAEQNYELVGVRIGAILKEELASQATLLDDATLNPNCFYERTTTIGVEKFPVLNVAFASDIFSNQHQGSADGLATFNIDVYTSSKNKPGERADELSAKQLKRILGLCRSILSHPAYKTLSFDRGMIHSVTVSSIIINDPGNILDAKAALMGRLVFTVKMLEETTYQDAVLLGTHTTNVRLSSTDLGYTYELIIDNDESGSGS